MTSSESTEAATSHSHRHGAAVAEEKPATPAAQAKAKAVHDLIMTRVYWAMGAGLVPVPMIDLAAIASVQVKLLEDLSDHYGKDFAAERGKKVISVLTSSVGTGMVATGAVASLLKIIPGLGSIGGAVALPAVAGASTYALGKVFERHFEQGGDLLDFEVEKAKEYYGKVYEEGKRIVSTVKKEIHYGIDGKS
jgi:uncharacterized protein (DUF697 family)